MHLTRGYSTKLDQGTESLQSRADDRVTCALHVHGQGESLERHEPHSTDELPLASFLPVVQGFPPRTLELLLAQASHLRPQRRTADEGSAECGELLCGELVRLIGRGSGEHL